MSIIEAFNRALDLTSATDDSAHLLPDRLARACVEVVPFDSAGLSFTLLPDRRLPLGASDPDAATAERLQFALGDGPCASSQRSHTALFCTQQDLHTRWPVYATQLAEQTSFTSTLALPLGGPLAGVAALDLYRRQAEALAEGDLATITEIAAHIGTTLAEHLAAATELDELGLPPDLRTPRVLDRQRIWVAIGYLAGQRGLLNTDALALLRATAFTNNLDLETAADRVLSGELRAL